MIYQSLETHLRTRDIPILLVGNSEKNPLLNPILHQPYLSVLFDLVLLTDLAQLQTHCYRVVIFNNILNKLDFLIALDIAKTLLINGGEIYFIDHISQKLSNENSKLTPLVAHYLIAQAQRCGFALLENLQEKSLTLLHFQQQRESRWRVLPVTEQHKAATQALFKQVFNTSMSNAMWQWKYGQQRGVAIGVWQQEQLVAHYGGMQRQLLYFGQRRMGIQIGDVMVLPAERGRLTKHGAFFLSASTFSERHVGYGTPHFLAYGFPNARHIKVAEKLNIYAKVDDVVEITWNTAAVARVSKWQYVVKLINPHALQRVVTKLWTQMQRELQQHIALVRDWEYIEYRYLQRPEKIYTFLVIYDLFLRPVGLVVIAIESDLCRFMDYLGSLRHISRVMHQICAYLQQQRIEHITGWFSATIAEHFARSGGQVVATEIVLPTIIWGQNININKIKRHWWLTTGDTDFL